MQKSVERALTADPGFATLLVPFLLERLEKREAVRDVLSCLGAAAER